MSILITFVKRLLTIFTLASAGWLRPCFALGLVASLALISLACDIVGDDAPDPEAYRTPVAQAQAAGLPVYWLGPEFKAGGLSFDFIEGTFPQGIAGVRLNGLQLSYLAREGDSVRASLDVLSFSKDEWPAAEDGVIHPPGFPSSVVKNTTLRGARAMLVSIPLDTPAFASLRLIVDLEDVVVVAQTTSAIVGGRDINPLVDEQTFLPVLENLRPHPQ